MSDHKEREAIEKVAKRIKEQNEKFGQSTPSYQDALKQARDVAVEHDRKQGR